MARSAAATSNNSNATARSGQQQVPQTIASAAEEQATVAREVGEHT